MSLTDVMTAHADDPMFKLVFKKRTPSVGFQAGAPPSRNPIRPTFIV
jgi:hypothetical protein